MVKFTAGKGSSLSSSGNTPPPPTDAPVLSMTFACSSSGLLVSPALPTPRTPSMDSKPWPCSRSSFSLCACGSSAPNTPSVRSNSARTGPVSSANIRNISESNPGCSLKGLMTKPVDSMSWPIVTTATSRVDPTRMPSMINTSSAGMKLTTPTPPTCANSPMVPRTAAFSRTDTMCAGARVWAIRVPPADPASPFVAFDAGAVPFVGSVTDPREKPLGC